MRPYKASDKLGVMSSMCHTILVGQKFSRHIINSGVVL